MESKAESVTESYFSNLPFKASPRTSACDLLQWVKVSFNLEFLIPERVIL